MAELNSGTAYEWSNAMPGILVQASVCHYNKAHHCCRRSALIHLDLLCQGIYPTAIIVLVALQRTTQDVIDSVTHVATSRTDMEFAQNSAVRGQVQVPAPPQSMTIQRKHSKQQSFIETGFSADDVPCFSTEESPV